MSVLILALDLALFTKEYNLYIAELQHTGTSSANHEARPQDVTGLSIIKPEPEPVDLESGEFFSLSSKTDYTWCIVS